MRLALDEMLSPAIAKALRARGHDVVAVKERREWIGLSDADPLDVARLEGRAVVTSNLRDLRPLHAATLADRGTGHAGLVFVPTSYRLAKASTGRLVEALEATLAAFPADDAQAPPRGCGRASMGWPATSCGNASMVCWRCPRAPGSRNWSACAPARPGSPLRR